MLSRSESRVNGARTPHCGIRRGVSSPAGSRAERPPLDSRRSRGLKPALLPPSPVIRILALILSILLLGLVTAVAQDFSGERDLDAVPHVADGFRAQFFAREPQVRNVNALAFDKRGRLFVAESRQWRQPTRETPSDRIKILIDQDDDGVADEAKLFADGFFSIQSMAWKGDALWVANAPNLTMVRDLDGDDVADQFTLIFTGLGTLEHGLHGLNWAPDGQLYMSKGDTPVQPYAPKVFRDLAQVSGLPGSPDVPPIRVFDRDQWNLEWRRHYVLPTDGHVNGGIVRYDPARHRLQLVSTGLRNPWDISFDTQFNWLGTDNDDVSGDRIVSPFYGAHFGHWHPWSNSWTGEDHLPSVPISGPLFEGSGVGVVYCQGDSFPARYREVFFIGDWLLGRVYAFRPQWDGSLLRTYEPLDVFAEGGPTKSLFRPTDLKMGPGGALYIAGWGASYAYTPKSEGRVYRVVPESVSLGGKQSWDKNRPQLPLRQWTFEQLLADLGSDLEVLRVDAQEELVRRGSDVHPKIFAALESGELSQGQETWLVWALTRGDPQQRSIDIWLSDRVPQGQQASDNIRIQAIRGLAFRASSSGSPRPLPMAVLDAAHDAKPRIRFAAVQAIWETQQSDAIPVLKKVILAEEVESATQADLPQTDPHAVGLVGEWFGSAQLVRKVADDRILDLEHDWTGDKLRGNSWSARWRGFLIAPITGEVAFSAEARTGLRLKIDGRKVIDAWRIASSRADPKSMFMEEGKVYPITLEYFHTGTSSAGLKVMWQWSGKPLHVVPRQALSYRLARKGDRLIFFTAWRALGELMTQQQRVALLSDQEAALRLAALLGLLHDRTAQGREVLRASKDPDARIAAIATSWLGKVGHGLHEPEPIAEHLQSLDHRHVDSQLRLSLLKTMQGLRVVGKAWDVLNKMYFERYGKATLSWNEVVWQEKGREYAAAMKAAVSDPRTVEVYWQALSHGWPNVRAAAVTDFFRLGQTGREMLLKRLSLSDENERRSDAIKALARFGYRDHPWVPTLPIVEALHRAYQADSQIDLRQAVLQLLQAANVAKWKSSGARDRAVSILRMAAADPDPRIHLLIDGLSEKLGESIEVAAPQRKPATLQSVLPLVSQADPERGRALFFDVTSVGCANCHRVHNDGRSVGPDLSGIASRATTAELLISILQPSAVITEGFNASHIATVDGRDLEGMVHDETDRSLTLVLSDGQSEVLDKDEISERIVLDLSLMPSGMDVLLSNQELADLVAWLLTLRAPGPSAEGFSFKSQRGHLGIRWNGQTIATYVFDDPRILRPFFRNLKTPSGLQVTRNHPPVTGRDDTDHETMHPGLWLAFMNISGQDFWRNQGRVVHEAFTEPPTGGRTGRFATRSRYESSDGTVVCRQETNYTLESEEAGYLLLIDARFSADRSFTFNEDDRNDANGLAVRMATPLTVKNGGSILNDLGGRDEKGTGGRVARWWDYFGQLDNRSVGMMILSAPSNPPAWALSRDYGCLVVNPFPPLDPGRRSHTIKVEPGETFRLTFGVMVHENKIGESLDREGVFGRFVSQLANE